MEEQQHNIKNSQNIELNVEIKETSKTIIMNQIKTTIQKIKRWN